jgi:hypothetical protein
MYYMQKLFLSRMEGDDINAHLDKMSKVFERLNSLTNPKRPLTQDNFFSTAIFTSLSQEWLPCVLALMNEPYVSSSKVIAALKKEGLRQKACTEDILNSATTASARTKPQLSVSKGPCDPSKHCPFCKVDGHDLNNCFNTARILREQKSKRGQPNSNSSNPGQPDKSKLKKVPKTPAKAGRTSAAPLGGTAEESDYSGLEYEVTSCQAVCSLSSSLESCVSGDLNLDSGCSMTMVPTASVLTNLKKDITPVHLANQSTVEATNKGLFPLPLLVKTNVKALVVPALHEPLLSMANLCNNNMRVVFHKNGCKITTANGSDTSIGRGYRRGNLYYLPAEPLSSHFASIPPSGLVDNSLMSYHL